MVRIIAVLLVLFLFPAGVDASATATYTNTEIHDGLLALQANRNGETLNSSQLVMFEKMLAQGIPTEQEVGSAALETVGPLLLVAKADPKFQQHALDELRARIGIDVDARGYAYMEDSVSIEQGQAESYGSVFVVSGDKATLPPQSDERKVDELRDTLGLESVALELRSADDLLATGVPMASVLTLPTLFTPRVDLTQPDLRKDLDRRFARDQETRAIWDKSGNAIGSPEEKAVKLDDADNTAAITHILDQYGFPTAAMVGRRGVTDAFLLVQHSVDITLMRRALILARPVMLKGDMPRGHYALMVDRMLMLEKKNQLYGSQARAADGKLVPYPIIDQEAIEQRRTLMRLQTMKSYYAELNGQ